MKISRGIVFGAGSIAAIGLIGIWWTAVIVWMPRFNTLTSPTVQKNWNSVRTGMSYDSVVSLLGAPINSGTESMYESIVAEVPNCSGKRTSEYIRVRCTIAETGASEGKVISVVSDGLSLGGADAEALNCILGMSVAQIEATAKRVISHNRVSKRHYALFSDAKNGNEPFLMYTVLFDGSGKVIGREMKASDND